MKSADDRIWIVHLLFVIRLLDQLSHNSYHNLHESLFNILNQNWGKSEEKKVWLSVKVLGGEVVIANVAAIFLI